MNEDEILQSIKDGVSVAIPAINRYDFLDAVERGVKDAFLTALESGDGYSGPIIREPILAAIERGTEAAILEINNE